MNVLEVKDRSDRITLRFESESKDINAYSLASALVGLADAVREANAAVNAGYRVEVVVEALSEGSFQATVRTIFTSAKNLFTSQAAQAIIFGIISTHIYEKFIKADEPVKVTVSEELVIVESGKQKIVVPRTIYEAKKQLENSEKFGAAIGKVFAAATSDVRITGLTLVDDPNRSDGGTPTIPREKFEMYRTEDDDDESVRELIESATLEISRAILARGNRKWEFYWRGVKIAAPVLDESFYDRFFAHDITIAPGDVLDVSLKIVQERHADTGIFVNVRYEVMTVNAHQPRMKQDAISDG
ncbi:MAG TPA: hypothetical protein PK586_00380 [Casimicrobium sp.]|nr:hypothetical protein [Casimicrobium sp.]